MSSTHRFISRGLFIGILAACTLGCGSNEPALHVQYEDVPPIQRRNNTPMPDEYVARVQHDVLNQTLATINFMELRTLGKYVTAEKYDKLGADIFDLLAQARATEGGHRFTFATDAARASDLFAAQRMIFVHGVSQVLYLHQRYHGRLPTDEELARLIEPFLEVEGGPATQPATQPGLPAPPEPEELEELEEPGKPQKSGE